VLKVVILPVGQVADDVLQFIQRGLKEVFRETEVAVLETVMPIPDRAYNLSRRQYHSTYILAKMSNYVRSIKAERVLGITEADLYVPNLNFVFGEAQCPGKVAIVSLFRAGVEGGCTRDRPHTWTGALPESVVRHVFLQFHR
jgi:archaemetzincin